MKTKHIALIPARKDSVGFRFKNRLFFDNTANFLDKTAWFDDVIVSSNDHDIIDKAIKRNYSIHNRSEDLSGSNVSIKEVMVNIIEEMKIDSDTYIWLFSLPLLYKNKSDFDELKSIISSNEFNSICSFKPAQVHPFYCWMYDNKSSKLAQYISNDVYRRQDLPKAWELYHYLCAFKAGYINKLNSELISEDTHPFFLNQATADKLVEIDTPEDYEKWKRLNSYEH